MTTGIFIFTERVHAINQEYQLLFQRSLVDLALSDRHDYWDVETLEEAIDNIGFPAIIRELQAAGESLSTSSIDSSDSPDGSSSSAMD